VDRPQIVNIPHGVTDLATRLAPIREYSILGARLRATSYSQFGTFHKQCHPSSQV